MAANTVPENDCLQRFHALDTLLHQHRELWQLRPFHYRVLPWSTTHPTLAAALQRLNDAQLTALEAAPLERLQWLRPWLGEASARLAELCALPRLPARDLAVPARLDTGIPGRKWQQIKAFAARMPDTDQQVLEWCAGKGHLGRLLATSDRRPVTSIERDPELCRAGRQLAARWAASVEFCEMDVLCANAGALLPRGGHAVALHACGDLHTTLLQHWTHSECARLSLSPCCYDAIAQHAYQPLSRPGAASELRLSRTDLQLTQQETVTGSCGTRRKRQRELWWRLAFDEWQRTARASDSYLPLPSLPTAVLRGSFSEFLRYAAALKHLPAPDTVSEQQWLEQGARRRRLLRRIELVTHVFQRPLEIWLALDRALLLQESGADVRLGTFCDYQLTPRNLLIDARRPGYA